jgi:catechol 2,3-dioxygenase-like lactoylglutathione lyase family enzyme
LTSVLAHRGIGVRDLERSRRFYEHALGFTPCERTVDDEPVLRELAGRDDAMLHSLCVRSGNVTLELLQFECPPMDGRRERRPLNEFGTTHLCFWTPLIEDTAERIERHGGTAHWHTLVTAREFSTRVMYCTDPDGTRVEIGERRGHPLEFLHSGLCVHDVDATLGFYSSVLGCEKIEETELRQHAEWLGPLMELDSPALVPRVLETAGGDRIELIVLDGPPPFGSRRRPPPNRYGLNHTTFLVDSLPRATAAALRAGAIDPVWCGRGGSADGIAFVCADPNGATLVMMERRS